MSLYLENSKDFRSFISEKGMKIIHIHTCVHTRTHIHISILIMNHNITMHICVQNLVWGLSGYSDWHPSYRVYRALRSSPKAGSEPHSLVEVWRGALFNVVADKGQWFLTALLGRAKIEAQACTEIATKRD